MILVGGKALLEKVARRSENLPKCTEDVRSSNGAYFSVLFNDFKKTADKVFD